LLAGVHPRGGGSPEMADLGLPGPILDGIRPWRMLATRVTHLGSWRRSAGVAMAHATAWAARVSKARRRARVPVPTVVYDPRRLALMVRGGGDAMLTKGLQWLKLQRKMADGEILRLRRVGVRGEGCCRGSPGSWSPWINAWGSCEGTRGIRGVRGSPATKNCGGGVGYRWRSSARFPHGRARGRGVKTRGASWRGGEAAASLGRGWDAPERPTHDGAEALHGGASGRRR
jgi:hypothetical protein